MDPHIIHNNQIDLKDVTFIIPVRIDSIERLENLQLVTNYLLENFQTHILIVEAADRNNQFLSQLLNSEIEIFFTKDSNAIFHRTKYINFLAKKVFTPFVAVWDSDVLVAVDQVKTAINLFRRKLDDFVYPYDGRFLDTGIEIRKKFMAYRNINDLEANLDSMIPLYGFSATGGGFYANILSYMNAGLENESFAGWGVEDVLSLPNFLIKA